MDRCEKERLLRKRFNVPDGEVIPSYVIDYLPLEQVPLTDKELEWAKKVAERISRCL